MSDEKSLIRFGVIADPQYADAEPWAELDRHFRESPRKLSQAIEVFNGEDLSFVVTLGDLIDRDWESYADILPLYDALRHESFLMPGNHDFVVPPERLAGVHEKLAMPAPFHDFERNGLRFVVIEGNEVSLFSTPEGDARRALARKVFDRLVSEGAINAKPWNAGIGDDQFAWLGSVLEKARAAGEKVVVMGHYPLYPQNDHNLWHAERLVTLFEQAGNVIAYLNGHNHAGNLGRHGSTWYVNFKGMVDTRDENAFAVVEIFRDRIEITGHGREESRSLPL